MLPPRRWALNATSSDSHLSIQTCMPPQTHPATPLSMTALLTLLSSCSRFCHCPRSSHPKGTLNVREPQPQRLTSEPVPGPCSSPVPIRLCLVDYVFREKSQEIKDAALRTSVSLGPVTQNAMQAPCHPLSSSHRGPDQQAAVTWPQLKYAFPCCCSFHGRAENSPFYLPLLFSL